MNETDRIETEIARRHVAGDPTAFAELYAALRVPIRTWVSRHRGTLLSEEDLDEIVDDVFVNMHRNLPRFRWECSVRTWALKIGSNLSLNRVARNGRRRMDRSLSLDARVGESGERLHETLADRRADVIGDVELDERASRSALALLELPERFRVVLDLRVNARMSYAEIAEVLRVKVGTVKSKIARARLALREAIGEAA